MEKSECPARAISAAGEHRPPKTLQLPTQPRVVGGEQLAHILWIHPLRPRGKPDQIGEQDGHDLAFLSELGRRRSQRRAALGAELRARLVLLPTGDADAHAGSLDRGRGR